MDKVFASLKSTFNAAATLVPSPFQAGLYLNEPPETGDAGGKWPIVVLLNPNDKVKVNRVFNGKHESWRFPCVFQVVHFRETEAVRCARLIDAVFGVPGWKPTLGTASPYQYTCFSWLARGGTAEQIKEDVWIATTRYDIGYQRDWIP